MRRAQVGLREAHLQDPSGAGSSIMQVMKIRGPLDEEALVKAFHQVWREFENLQVRFENDGDEWWEILPADPPPLPLITIDLRSEEDPEGVAQAQAHDLRMRGFDLLGEDSLVRMELMRLSDEEHWLAIAIQHVVTDGYSGLAFRDRIAQVYSGLVDDQPIPRAPVMSMADFRQLEEPPSADLAFWQAYLEGSARLLGRMPGSAHLGPHTHWLTEVLPTGRADLDRRHGHRKWPYAVTAAIAESWAAEHGWDEVVLGMALSGRHGSEDAHSPGQMMTTLPLRLTVGAWADEAAALDAVRAEVRVLHDHGKDRPEMLRGALPSAWRSGRLFGPLVNVIPFESTPVFSGCVTEVVTLSRGPVEDAVVTVLPQGEEGLAVEIHANTMVWTAEEAAHHHAAWVRRIRAWAGR